jgi:hypothetical protein
MTKFFQDHQYFTDPQENKEFISWVYQRNSQMYNFLGNGMTYREASEIFGLTSDAIKARYKIFKRKFTNGYHKAV